jgi:hypothetical protein
MELGGDRDQRQPRPGAALCHQAAQAGRHQGLRGCTQPVIVDLPGVWLLERHGSPAALRKASRRRLVELIRPKAPRMATRLMDDVFDTLDEQTVVVPGTATLDIVIPTL